MTTDIRAALRSYRGEPGFLLLVTATLGIGIGVSSAMYSFAEGLLFRPLLLPDLERLVMVGGTSPNRPDRLNTISSGDYFDWREQTKTLQHLSVYGESRVNVGGDGEPENVRAGEVSFDFFEAMGARPVLGRGFQKGDDLKGAPRTVVLSHDLWQRRYGGDPDVLQRVLLLEGAPHQVIGVMGSDMEVPATAELWLPYEFTGEQRNVHANFFFLAAGRLAPGATLDQARAELRAIATRTAGQFPDSHRNLSASAQPFREVVSGPETASYTRLALGAALALLLLACVNVANLHFARVSGRARELAVRSALGASRIRLIAQLLAESAVLGLLGGVAGIFISAWTMDVLRRYMPPEVMIYLPGWKRVSIHGSVLAFNFGIALAAGIVAGLAAALTGSLTAPQEVLRESSRGSTSGRSRHRVRNLLVVVQVVLAMILLAGAGLMVYGFRAIARPALAMAPETVLTAHVHLLEKQYPDARSANDFTRRLLPGLRSMPGVETVALTNALPYTGYRSSYPIAIEGQATSSDMWRQLVQQDVVSTSYFETLRIRVRGRTFAESDGPDAPRVAIVNETFARRHFPGEDPIGRRVRLQERDAPWMTIVGVSADVRHRPEDNEIRPVLYRPMDQNPRRGFLIVARTLGDPDKLGGSLRGQVFAVDRNQPVSELQSFSTLIRNQLLGYWYIAAILGACGLIALLLATVGVYSLLSHVVAERRHEIGVRMALGASRGNLVWEIVRKGLALTGAGAAVGLAGSYALARLLANLLVGGETGGWIFLGTVALLLTATAALASYLPARRASRIDPILALKQD